MGICLTALFLIAIPVLIGFPWANLISQNRGSRMLACLPIGFFMELSLFQLLTFPFAFWGWRFSVLCWVTAALLILWGGVSLYHTLHNKLTLRRKTAIKWDGWSVFYACLFFILLIGQVYQTITLDSTYFTYDDSMYAVMANDALKQDRLFVTNPYTGIAGTLNVHRALQSFLVFPAFLSFFSRVPITIMEHTVLAVYYLLIAYIVYAWMGSVLFEKTEETFIFLIFISLLYLFGFYSIYSATFRLLGPNYQGKAVLAVSYVPMLLSFLITALDSPYNKKVGGLLMFLSIGAAGLTLFGTITVAANAVAVICLAMMRKKREWRHLFYVLWACVFPAIYAGIFFIDRFMI